MHCARFFFCVYPICREQPSDAGVAPSASVPEQSSITSHLHNDLSALRDLRTGFIVRHGSEPSVSFRFGHQSTSNSTISLRVGDESTATVPSTSDSYNDHEMVSINRKFSCLLIVEV